MRKDFLTIYAIVLLFFMVQGVAALSVMVEPTQIQPGDPVTISIQGLDDNSTLSLQIESRFAIAPDGGFTYETDNLVLPFTLNNGTFTAVLKNTKDNVIDVHKGDTEVKRVAPSQNGQYNVTQTGTIPAGTYDYIILSGTAAPGAQEVVASVSMQGTKQGPRDSTITFRTTGLTEGTITVRVSVNGVQALSETIHISTPVVTPSIISSDGGDDSSGVSHGGGVGIAISSTTPVLTPRVNITATGTVNGQSTPMVTLTEQALSTTRAPDTPTPPIQSQAVPATPNPTRTNFPLIAVIVSLGLVLFVISRRV